MKQFYQVVREYGRNDIQYTVYEARKDRNGISIASIPFVLVGNHPDEIVDTLKQITKDMTMNPPVDKNDCDIIHDTLWLDDDDYLVDEDWDEAELDEYASRLSIDDDEVLS